MRRSSPCCVPILLGLLAGILVQALPSAWEPLAFSLAMPTLFFLSHGWATSRAQRNVPTPQAPPLYLALGYGVAWAAGSVWQALR